VNSAISCANLISQRLKCECELAQTLSPAARPSIPAYPADGAHATAVVHLETPTFLLTTVMLMSVPAIVFTWIALAMRIGVRLRGRNSRGYRMESMGRSIGLTSPLLQRGLLCKVLLGPRVLARSYLLPGYFPIESR
jgi:hypothetical protein